MDHIADRIRALRKEKNMTLRDLSEKTELSISFLSQVENGSSSLAITSLKKIAEALGVAINYFFEVPEVHNFSVKSQDKRPFKIEGSDSEFIRLSGNFPGRKMEAMITIIPPNHQHGSNFKHPGEEFAYILEGVLIATVGGKEYVLKTGDSIHYPSDIDHSWVNPIDQPVRILSILTPVIF